MSLDYKLQYIYYYVFCIANSVNKDDNDNIIYIASL